MSDTEKELQGEIVDERTGEEIPKGANQIMLASNQNTHVEIAKVGTLELTPQAEEVLNEKLNPADVRIRPDGLVYLPWTYYAARLNKAFGRLQWGLLPQGAPHVKPQGDYGDVLVVWGFWLAIKGVPIGFAYGETTYKPSNATMSYGDACEGAKSISLARNCKQLGIALELWDGDWVAAWKKDYAETYPNPNQNAKQKFLWRKKGQKQAPKSEPKPTTAQNQTPAPQNSTQATETVETTPEPAQEPVVPSGDVSKGFSLSDLRKSTNVQAIQQKTGLKAVEIVAKINDLDKSKTYTIERVVALIANPVSETENNHD
jgi:hypothetical protein